MVDDSTLPGRGALRVTQQDSVIRDLMEKFPMLSRTEISDVIARHGPMRVNVEAELGRLSSRKR